MVLNQSLLVEWNCLLGSGHSRIMVEKCGARYGSFAGFTRALELSLTFTILVGAMDSAAMVFWKMFRV